MKTFKNNKLLIIIWFVHGSAVYASPDASTTGGNGDKYAEIIPHGGDPLDSFAYSLLVEHLKRPPSRISTNGEPIEHAYYVVDTHRRPDGSPVHNSYGPVPSDLVHLGSSNYENSEPASQGASYQSNDPSQSQLFQSATVPEQRNDPSAKSPQHDDAKVRENASFQVSLNPTTIQHPNQDPHINGTFEYGTAPELGNKNHETQEKYVHIPNSFSQRGSHSFLQNSVANTNEKDTKTTPMNALSDRLTRLSQSLKRLQMLTNPIENKPQSLAQLAATVVQSFGAGGSPFLPLSHFLPTTPEPSTVHQVQQNKPQTKPISVQIGHQLQQISPSSTPIHSVMDSHNIGLEQGIPTNLNEEMAMLEESLHTTESNPQQQQQPVSESLLSNDQSRAYQNLFDSQSQQTQHLPMQHQQPQPSEQFRPPPPPLETTVVKNVSDPSAPVHVLYHHSVSHKIPDPEMDKVINDPDIQAHSILYSHDAQPQPGSHVIFKNQYFKVQSPNPAQFQYFGGPPPRPPRPQRPRYPNGFRPTPSTNTVLDRAVQALNNYNDVFLKSMINSNEQYRKYLKPNDFSAAPSQTSDAPQKVLSALHVVDVYEQKPPPPKNQRPQKFPPIIQRIVNKFQGLTTQTKPSSAPPSQQQYQNGPQSQHQPKISSTTEQPKTQQRPEYSRVVLRPGQQPENGRQNFGPPNFRQGNQHFNQPPTYLSNRPGPLDFLDLHDNLLGSASSNPSSVSSPAISVSPTEQKQHENTEPLKKEGLKSDVIPPTPQPKSTTSSEAAKYSTIFLRTQGGGGRRTPQKFWHRPSQMPNGGFGSRPINHQTFKDFGKVF